MCGIGGVGAVGICHLKSDMKTPGTTKLNELHDGNENLRLNFQLIARLECGTGSLS